MRFPAALIVLISALLTAQNAMDQGIAALKNGSYREALDFFAQEEALHPNDAKLHLNMGLAYVGMGLAQENTHRAVTEFKKTLELEPTNKMAMAALASLSFNASTQLQGDEKVEKLDEAMEWNRQLSAVDPTNKDAFYAMGMIAWAKWHPVYIAKRLELHMKPEDPGPLPFAARQELKTKYLTMLEEALANLDRALQLDPQYSEAMSYKNLLIREKADLADSREEYAKQIVLADEWFKKALKTPARIRVSGAVQESNLIHKEEPVFPPLAKQAHVEGVVRFTVIIAKDGSILNTQLISGHPLLVAAAQEALKKYVYKPTLVNGAPVEVVTTVDIRF
jgi:tetratricopeptide (TPR) repeat protein